MRPKDRMLLAIEHREPDCVPIDFITSPEVVEKLYAYFGHRDYDLSPTLILSSPTLPHFPYLCSRVTSSGNLRMAHAEWRHLDKLPFALAGFVIRRNRVLSYDAADHEPSAGLADLT